MLICLWIEAHQRKGSQLSNAFQNNLMSTLGKNIYNIAQDCNCYPSDLTKLYVKSNLTYAELSFWWKFLEISIFKGIANG